jgi:hypothetical protein
MPDDPTRHLEVIVSAKLRALHRRGSTGFLPMG